MSLTIKQFNAFMRLILSDVNEAIEELKNNETNEAKDRLQKLADNIQKSIED